MARCSIITKIFSVVLMAVADTNYRFVYVDIGSYGKDCDSTVFKRSTLWTSIQTNMLELPSERLFQEQKVQMCTTRLCRRWGICTKQKYTLTFGGYNLSVKKECTTIACAEHECMLNVFLVFWAINGEFSSDRLMSVLTLQSSLLRPALFCTVLFMKEMFISF